MKFSPGIIENLKKANEIMANVQDELSKVQEKKEIMGAKLPETQEMIERTSQEKTSAFDRFLVDQATEKAVDEAQQRYDQAMRAKERTEEVLKALTDKEAVLNGKLHKVREQQAHAEGIIWNALSNQVMVQIGKELSDKIYYGYAANLRKFSSMSWETFLYSLFARPDGEILKDYAGKLDKLFQKEAEGN